MKKKYLFLLPLLLMPLTACDLSNLVNKGDDDDDSAEASEPGAGEKLSFDKKEVVNKLKTYGQTTGFDISATVKSSTNESEGESNSSIEVAMKENMVWLISDDGSYAGVELNENTVTAFASEDGVEFETSEVGQDELNGKTPEEYFDDYMETLTSWFYFAEEYKILGLTKVKDFTFVGRSASEYAYHMSYGGVSATYKTYIDNELGITLYWLGEAVSPEEGTDSSEFKVTSFLSGSQVNKPNIHQH